MFSPSGDFHSQGGVSSNPATPFNLIYTLKNLRQCVFRAGGIRWEGVHLYGIRRKNPQSTLDWVAILVDQTVNEVAIVRIVPVVVVDSLDD